MNPLDLPEPGFRERPPLDIPAPPAPDTDRGAPASVREAARRRRLRARLLRAGREAVDERELLEILLSGLRTVCDTGALAAGLLETFGTAARVLAARPDRLRSVPGLSGDAIAVLKSRPPRRSASPWPGRRCRTPCAQP